MLLRNKDELEVVSRERKDRRDFEQLSAMAARMGLHRYLIMYSNLASYNSFSSVFEIWLFWQPSICKSCRL